MAKRYYRKGEFIWIKTLNKRGKVQSLDVSNLKASVVYYENGKSSTVDLAFTDIDKLRSNGKVVDQVVNTVPSKTKTKTKIAIKDKNPNVVLSIPHYSDKIVVKKNKWEDDELATQDTALVIKIKYIDKEIDKVNKIAIGDWIDLRSSETVKLKAGEFYKLPLGVAMELPEGYEAHVSPRGSTFKNFGVVQTNSVGVVDEAYKGDEDQWFLPILAFRDITINKNDRICQFRIMKKMPEVRFEEAEYLGNENRGGHGSTGIK